MEFDWRQEKSDTTLAKRGFDFNFAVGIFAGPVVEGEDARMNYGETRIKSIGETKGVILVVIYTDRDGIRRIISARRANKKERTLWQSFVAR